MLQATRHDWQVLSTTASVPWLRQVIDHSLPPDGDDDAVVTVDVVLNTRRSRPVLMSSRTGS